MDCFKSASARIQQRRDRRHASRRFLRQQANGNGYASKPFYLCNAFLTLNRNEINTYQPISSLESDIVGVGTWAIPGGYIKSSHHGDTNRVPSTNFSCPEIVHNPPPITTANGYYAPQESLNAHVHAEARQPKVSMLERYLRENEKRKLLSRGRIMRNFKGSDHVITER